MVKNVLKRKMLREITANFKQYISVILIAILSVTLFTGLLANYYNFRARVDKAYELGNASDVYLTINEFNKFIVEDLKTNDTNIQELEYRFYTGGKAKSIDVSHKSSAVYIVVAKSTNSLNVPFSTSKTLDAGDVFVDELLLEKLGIKVLDEIELSIGGIDYQMNFQITGTMLHPEGLSHTKSTANLIYVTEEALFKQVETFYPNDSTMIKNLLSTKYNQILIKTSDINKTQTIANNYFANNQKTKLLYNLTIKDMPSTKSIEADITQAKELLYIFPVIFYLVGILIILTTLSQLIAKDRMNIGVMKAIGYNKKEIIKYYVGISVALALIGSVIGIIIGPLIIPNVMNIKYNILYQLPKAKFPMFKISYLFSVLILVFISFILAYAQTIKEIKRKPAESIRGESAIKVRPLLLDKCSFSNKLPLSIKMSLRNIKRKISRTLMVVLGVLGCAALLSCGFGIEDTLNYGINKEVDELLSYDINVTYSISGIHKDSLLAMSNINEVHEYTKYDVTLINKKAMNSYLYILEDDAKSLAIDYSNGAVASEKVANELNLKIGDFVSYVFNNETYNVEITNIAKLSITHGIFIAKSNCPLDFSPTGAYTFCQEKENSKLTKTANLLTNLDFVSTALSLHDFKIQVENAIGSIRIMTLTVKIFAILLAIVVIYNLSLLNLTERTRDIATLKVLGFNQVEVGLTLILEIFIMTFIGSIFGLLCGYPLLKAVLMINETPLIEYIYHINISSYLIAFLLTCGVSILINLIMVFKSKKIKMVESLKSIE